MTDTYTKENMIRDTRTMKQGHTCQSHCFMRETCGKESMRQSVFNVTDI